MQKRWHLFGFFTLIALSLFFIYGSHLHAPWLGYDDELYTTENLFVTASRLDWSLLWTGYFLGEWVPATTLVNRFLYQLGGGGPFAFRLSSFFLHLFNIVLLFTLFRSVIKSRAILFFSIAYFALHPIGVESLVWISARKDLQANFFLLLTLNLYRAFLVTPPCKHRLSLYLLSILAGSLAISSKPSMVALPLFVVVLEMARADKLQGFIRQSWKRVAPFASLALIAFVWFFVIARTTGNIGATATTTLLERMVGTGEIFSKIYLRNLFYPFELLPIYRESLAWSGFTLFHLYTMIFFSLFAWVLYAEKNPNQRKESLLIFLFGGIAFLPYCNLFELELVAQDHYFYLSTFTFGYLIAYLATRCTARFISRSAWALLILLLLFLVAQARSQVELWQRPVTLWNKTLSRYPHSIRGEALLATALGKEGRFGEAERRFQQVLQSQPGHHAKFNFAMLFVDQKKWGKAAPLFQDLTKETPLNPHPFLYLGIIHYEGNDLPTARSRLLQSLKLNSEIPKTWLYLGLVSADLRLWDEAKRAWEMAIKLDPENAKAAMNLAILYGQQGNRSLAKKYGQIFLDRCPNCPEAPAIRNVLKEVR